MYVPWHTHIYVCDFITKILLMLIYINYLIFIVRGYFKEVGYEVLNSIFCSISVPCYGPEEETAVTLKRMTKGVRVSHWGSSHCQVRNRGALSQERITYDGQTNRQAKEKVHNITWMNFNAILRDLIFSSILVILISKRSLLYMSKVSLIYVLYKIYSFWIF